MSLALIFNCISKLIAFEHKPLDYESLKVRLFDVAWMHELQNDIPKRIEILPGCEMIVKANVLIALIKQIGGPEVFETLLLALAWG